MESVLMEIIKTVFSRTDPVLVAVLIVLAILWYRTDKKINDHLSPKNKYPHPECQWGEKSYKALEVALDSQHKENREDHQIIFNLLRGVPVPDHLLNRKSEDGTR
jgi:hypothetical protein